MLRPSLLAAFLLQAAALRLNVTSPAVAAVVPVYPPHFSFLVTFLRQWMACMDGREAMDVFVVFTNQEDKLAFRRTFCAGQAGCERPYKELIITPSHVPLQRYRSWKKLDGLAQVLQLPSAPYEFALMMDAELEVAACESFPKLLPLLRQKHASKSHYGFRSDSSRPGLLMRRAACALSPPSIMGVQLAETAWPCNKDVLSKVSSVTADFQVYTWWNDLPYLHMDYARRMFEGWAAALDAAGYQRHGKSRSASSLSNAAEAVLPTFEQVTAAMGSAPDEASELKLAMYSFEHLVYQLYTVMYEDFQVVDLREKVLPHARVVSPGEGFCGLSQEEQEAYTKAVQPLWQVHGCKLYKMPYGYPLLRFHMDRKGASPP